MNSLPLSILCLATLAGTSLAQLTKVEPVLSERPPRPFSNKVEEGTAWTMTLVSVSEYRAKHAPESFKRDAVREANDAKFASSTVKRIDNAYSSGIRKETLFFADGSKLTRFVTRERVLYEDRKTGRPVLESHEGTLSGAVSGVDRLKELKWVSEKYYAGVATYEGRPCYVYRKYAPDQGAPGNGEGEAPAGAALSELANARGARIIETAFIDRATMNPVAHETILGVHYYTSRPFASFTLPASLDAAMKKEAAEAALMKQRYEIRQ